MKVSELKKARDASFMWNGEEVLFTFLPNVITRDNLAAYEGFVKAVGEDLTSELFDKLIQWTANCINWIDLQDDEGKDIEPTFDNLKKLDLEVPFYNGIQAGIQRARLVPLAPASASSNTGSQPVESLTPTT